MNDLLNQLKMLCPNGVEYRKLDTICSIYDGTHSTPQYQDEGVLFASVENIKSPYESNKYISEEDYEKYKIKPQIGDVLMTRIGSIGVCYVIDRNVPLAYYVSLALLRPNTEILDSRFLKYAIESAHGKRELRKRTLVNAVPIKINKDDIGKIVIPVPPMEVQREIVRVLDKFSLLSAELSAELSARKKQYEYYREELLSLKEQDVQIKTIGEVSTFRRGSFPQPYGNKEWYDGEGAMPFVQVADIRDDMRLVDDTNRKISLLAQPKSVFAPKGSIIISLQGSIGRIAVTQYDAYIDRTVAIFQNISDEVLEKYFVYQLQRIFSIKEKTARGSTIKTITKEEFVNFPIPVPAKSVQKEIVAILDKFDAICTDIKDGLPAEISARQKQYEYYRDELLTFKEKK